jgi:hypothetical protein
MGRELLIPQRKQGLNVLDAFISLFSGYPQSPISQAE